MSKRPPKPELPVVKLTPEQESLAALYAEKEKKHAAIMEQFKEDMKALHASVPKCSEHVWILHKKAKYEWWGEWCIHASVYCAICGTSGGWYCPVNPTRQCEYSDDDDMNCDSCIHCGQPDERK